MALRGDIKTIKSNVLIDNELTKDKIYKANFIISRIVYTDKSIPDKSSYKYLLINDSNNEEYYDINLFTKIEEYRDTTLNQILNEN